MTDNQRSWRKDASQLCQASTQASERLSSRLAESRIGELLFRLMHIGNSACDGVHAGPASDDPDVDPKGKRWDFDEDDEMRKRYPKLYKKFGNE
jgi:hypothetical protein